MRILDKNTDFYDYLQNVYKDDSTTFDRTDSFVLTKEIMCKHLYTYKKYLQGKCELHEYNFVLLQICNTFWIFLTDTTKVDEYDRPLDYTIELLATWKNYNRPRKLIQLDVVSFYPAVGAQWYKETKSWRYNKSNVLKRMDYIIKAIDTSDYKVISSVKEHTVFYGDGKRVEKHIPLLKASGLANCIDALDVYLSFEEYFSMEKTASERIYSKGITDKEKIENHGFDTKTSFRGK